MPAQVLGGSVPCSSRSSFVSCGGSSVREAFMGPDVRSAEMPPKADEAGTKDMSVTAFERDKRAAKDCSSGLASRAK